MARPPPPAANGLSSYSKRPPLQYDDFAYLGQWGIKQLGLEGGKRSIGGLDAGGWSMTILTPQARVRCRSTQCCYFLAVHAARQPGLTAVTAFGGAKMAGEIVYLFRVLIRRRAFSSGFPDTTNTTRNSRHPILTACLYHPVSCHSTQCSIHMRYKPF